MEGLSRFSALLMACPRTTRSIDETPKGVDSNISAGRISDPWYLQELACFAEP